MPEPVYVKQSSMNELNVTRFILFSKPGHKQLVVKRMTEESSYLWSKYRCGGSSLASPYNMYVCTGIFDGVSNSLFQEFSAASSQEADEVRLYDCVEDI